jgi:hypothetical protein
VIGKPHNYRQNVKFQLSVKLAHIMTTGIPVQQLRQID